VTTTLGDDFPKQQARVRECQRRGRELGTAGALYVALCEEALQHAEEAAISGDIVRILRAYQELKEIKS